MVKSIWQIGILLNFLFSVLALGAGKGKLAFGEDVAPLEEAPPLSKSVTEQGKLSSKLRDDISEAQLLDVDLRIDVLFSGGKSVEQGFAIPSVRFGASGELARFVDYRFALGPTREFSSALLPQVLPVEAWIRARNAGQDSWFSDASMWLKVGLFTPTFNPWWSPDLSQLPLPDYARTHKAVLINRDIGAELSLRPFGGSVELTAGIFNGSGIATQNTNNSKALAGSLRGVIPVWDWSLIVGLGGYSTNQSDRGSVNFISNWVANVFFVLESQEGWVLFGADILSGNLEDNTRNLSVAGGTTTLFARMATWLQIMARAEALRYSPATEPSIDRFQLGPVFEVNSALKTFLFYEYLNEGNGVENSVQVLVRLNI